MSNTTSPQPQETKQLVDHAVEAGKRLMEQPSPREAVARPSEVDMAIGQRMVQAASHASRAADFEAMAAAAFGGKGQDVAELLTRAQGLQR